MSQLIITLKDVKEAGPYGDNYNCPLVRVCKREFPERNINSVGIASIHAGLAYDIATIKPAFTHGQYLSIVETGEPFITEITFKDALFHPMTPDYYPELGTTTSFLQNSFEELEPNGY